MVGAVLVRDGEVVGEGFHRRAGEAHAEVLALASAGERARGATLYVNLEPCSHHGRTPPCAEAVVAAGVTRVVACHLDPDPRVSGRGFELLRRAGIAVDVGAHAREAIELNFGFLVHRAFSRPAVTLKWAMSLDGKVATEVGESRWISGPAARRWAIGLRDEHEAILVGSGTVLADDPRLDRRSGRRRDAIARVVVDRRLRTPVTARLFEAPGPILIFAEGAPASVDEALRARGAEVVRLPEVAPAPVLAALDARGIGSVLVEGGPTVAAAFFSAGAYDRLEIAVASKLLGGATAPGPLAGKGVDPLAAAPEIARLRARRCGTDLVLSGFNALCSRELFASLAR